MSEPNDYEDVVSEDKPEEDMVEIRKNLFKDFETAKTVAKDVIAAERESVKVFLRVRPFTTKEIDEGESQGCLEMENPSTVLMHPPKASFSYKQQTRSGVTAETVHRHRFTFSRVFGPDTNQKAFFEDTSLNFVKDFIDGQNCLVFSYGVTNAGKTYTILGNSQNLGILPRTIHILFNSIKDKNYGRANLKPKMFCDVFKLSSIQEEREESKKKMLLSLVDIQTYHGSINNTDSLLQDTSCEQSNHEVFSPVNMSSILDVTSINVDNQGPIQFSVWLSFAEIYNEQVFDLLEPISMGKDGKRTVLKLGDDRKGNPYIKGLTEIHVNNTQEAMKLLKIGRKNQKIASTKLNETSSRSHCIFTLKILRVINAKEPRVARVSRLSFVDLAGSERYTKTQNTGDRLKEAGNINTSIMTLGKCVELLRYNQSHMNNQKNIPFRESKLTRLFQGFFCGKGKASMIVNVNQCASAFDETLHALKFSALAKKVTTMVQETRLPPPPEAAAVSARSTRTSVVWADGSLSTPAGNKIRTELNETDLAPLAEEEESQIQGHTNQKLFAFISVLQGQIIEGKRNMALLEVKIREEVCQEMAEQMVEIETNYIERLKEDQRINEDLYEKRMDLLTKSVKKSRKRPRIERIEEEEDDEWVSSVFLHQEQIKVKEMGEQIAVLEQKLKIMEDERKEMNYQNEKMESLARTVKDYKIELETKTSQLMEAKKIQGGQAVMSSKTAAESNLFKQLEKRLDETTVALDKKNSQLISKNSIIGKLEKSLKDIADVLQGKEKELAELRMEKEQVLASKVKKNNGNEMELDEVNEELMEKESLLGAKQKEMKEVTENLKFVEEELQVLVTKDEESQKELEEMKDEMKVNKNKMENLNQIIDELKKQEAEGQKTNRVLQENYEKALADLANVQATVNVRNEKLEHYETIDKSLKDAYRDKESEIMKVKREVEVARNELRDKENAMEQVKKLFEKQMAEEIIKVNEEWESVTKQLKTGLKEQEEVFAQMDLDLTTKREALNNIGEENEKLIRNISDKNEKMAKLKQEKEHVEDQKERLKIKVFELETEVEKLQQEVKKEASKKDTATQALKDGLTIVKSKKKEYEEKTKALMKETEAMKGSYEEQVTALQEEITRLKSVDSESCTDEKISSTSEKESNSESDDIYKPVEVESFNLTSNNRVEIDVTPITGSGLKSGKIAKTKALKRKSSDLSLKEIKDQINSTKKKANKNLSEDDFTPVSVTKLRKTRSSSISGRSRQSKAVSPSSFSLSTLDENVDPQHNSQKSSTSGKRRFFNKLGIPESGKSKTGKDISAIPVKKRRRKLLKKSEISAPFGDSPLSKTDKEDMATPADRVQQLITRHLRSRVVKASR